MRTAAVQHKALPLCAQIDTLRASLENAALSGSFQEVLALSRELDLLINQVMLSPRRKLRTGYKLSAMDSHLYQSRPHAHRCGVRRTSSSPAFPYANSSGLPV